MLHPQTRPFRDTPVDSLQKLLPGAVLVRSEARGKQMMFEFSRQLWLGLHLGMTGRLRLEPSDFGPGKYDHLVLYQDDRALVFADPRQFGRVRFHAGQVPEWWNAIPPSLHSAAFTKRVMQEFLQRHRRLPIKAALLLQTGFPGVGNWMADEILWRAGLNPTTLAGDIRGDAAAELWKQVRFVCRHALKHIGPTYSELPPGWFFHQRWGKDGRCPRHDTSLRRETVGGRTTAWCPKCQKT